MIAIILEDEAIASRRLKRMIEDANLGVEVTHCFESIESLAKHLIDEPAPDVLFLDIHVADGNSFDLFGLVQVESKVIFVTAYNQYAVQAFRKNAIDYLLKPVKMNELKEAIYKADNFDSNEIQSLSKALPGQKSRFLVRVGTRLRIVKTSDLAYIYSKNKLSYFVENNGRQVASDHKLQYLIDCLDPAKFFRVNRQFIVHIDSIDSITSYSKSRVLLNLNPAFDGQIVVSSENTPRFKQWLNK